MFNEFIILIDYHRQITRHLIVMTPIETKNDIYIQRFYDLNLEIILFQLINKL